MFVGDMTLYVENLKDATKNTTRALQWIQESCRMQKSYSTSIGYTLYGHSYKGKEWNKIILIFKKSVKIKIL